MLTEIQQRMARPGKLEDDLWDLLGSENAPKLLVLTGSAGSGKSATINHLLAREHASPGRIERCLSDATHSESPDQQQVDRLAEFFRPFSDAAETYTGKCRLIAMNTGMAIRFFHDLPSASSPPKLTKLESVLKYCMGLPLGSLSVDKELATSVLVVNLDHRPTAGGDGDVLDGILQSLDPSSETGVFAGAPRCGTCQVRKWCWPMANATAITSATARNALSEAIGDVALSRGRQVAPRALWDAVAELSLSGLEDQEDVTPNRDLCFAIADVADAGNARPLISGLACSTALEKARPGTLLWDIAQRDPGFSATRQAHELVSDAGLDAQRDAERLRDWLAPSEPPHPAVLHAGELLDSAAWAVDEDSRWGRTLARAAWLAGALATETAVDDEYAAALVAQANGTAPGDEQVEATELALDKIVEGIASAFGVIVKNTAHFYPTATVRTDPTADVLVEVDLLDDELIKPEADPIVLSNERGAKLVGYRPISLSVSIDGKSVSVDYPLWQLLLRASTGSQPSATELERFLGLRQAIRRLGVKAGAADRATLLVRETGSGGRKYQITTRAGRLRAREVI
ncbi:hypothetical protein [Cellulosimicrobium sp. SJTW-1]|uniref:hypothetical protein n=1 Tax=Cellulosimicrobium sp. SJTW-1 TaxID=3078082 RepID=UPI0039EA05B1